MKKNIMQMYADEIAGYLKRIAELEAECKEHQEAMHEVDNTIKVLDKALELACANDVCLNFPIFKDIQKEIIADSIKYYKQQAKKELRG